MTAVANVSRSFTRGFRRWSLRPSAIVIFTLILAYRGGLWLQFFHQIDGASEANEPPPLLHWLRDSTLMVPLALVAVVAALLLGRWLLDRIGWRISPVLSGLLIVVTIAVLTSLAEAAASPIHNLLFQATEPVHAHGHGVARELPFWTHVLQDGLLALAANLVISGAVFVLLGGKVFGSEYPSPAKMRKP
jgi:hypothetical protein